MYCIPKGNDNKEADMENKTVTEIALMFGVDRHDISKWCKSNGYTFKVKTIDNWAKDNNILMVVITVLDTAAHTISLPKSS